MRKQHVLGLVAGALVGGLVALLSSALGYSLALNDGIFWGAVTGGVLSGVPEFAKSGAVLTHRNRPALNLVVGLAGSVLFLTVFAGLVLLLLNLFA